MKKFSASVLVACVAVVLLSGCAGITPIAGGTGGMLFTQTDAAVAVGSASGAAKVGTAESTAIICFATGDSSIQKAMQNGGITKIHHVDCKVFSVLGLYAKYTTVVYGE
jgi:uncharacterized protein YceK